VLCQEVEVVAEEWCCWVEGRSEVFHEESEREFVSYWGFAERVGGLVCSWALKWLRVSAARLSVEG
jgi:hypothetical protein